MINIIDTVYVFNQALMIINEKFQAKIIKDNQKNKIYKKLLFT